MSPLSIGTALLVSVLLAASGGDALSQTRGITVKLRANEKPDAPIVEEVPLYGASHALVVGIDDYTGGWPRLSNAVRDAKLIAGALRLKGFDVVLETNLTSAEMERTFKEFFIVKGADPDARLFVWFAGHGVSQGGEGFLVPADAPKPDSGARFKLSVLPMRRFGEYVRLAESKHVFAIFDSCFAGTVFDNQRALPPPAVTHATTLPVRQFLTSGDADQTVSDDGTFRELFIRAIQGQETSDANGDGYVTGSEIGLFLSDRVANLTLSRQTPRYGKLRDKDLDRGDFVFVLPAKAWRPPATASATSAPASASASATDKETLFWQSIHNSTNPAAFEAYIGQFPNGTFAPLARVKRDELGPTKEAQDDRVAALSDQIQECAATFEVCQIETQKQKKQIASLGRRLNVALASKVQELSRYRSEFFGRLRETLGSHPHIRVVGDRFVIVFELLFSSGSAAVEESHAQTLAELAATVHEIAGKIPEDINWVLRVDGHSDTTPISTRRFPSDWELSCARAISVVKHLIARGIPAKRLVPACFGANHPIDPRNDEIAHRRNRRIELRLTMR